MLATWASSSATTTTLFGTGAAVIAGEPKENPQMEHYLEDHPMTCKWLVAMVNKSPNWGCSPPKWPKMGGSLTKWDDPPSLGISNLLY